MHAQLAQQAAPGARGDADGEQRRRREQGAVLDRGAVAGHAPGRAAHFEQPERADGQRREHAARQPEHPARHGDGDGGRHGRVRAQQLVDVEGTEPHPQPREPNDEGAQPGWHAAG